MVLLANGLGASLGPADLLIRCGAAEFLCILPETGPADAVDRIAPVHEAMAGPPPFGVVAVGYASLQDGDSGQQLADRAASNG